MMTAASRNTSANGRRAHTPVMTSEMLDLLEVRSAGLYVDTTVGLGGHAAALAERSAPEGVVVGLDRDGESLALAGRNLERFGDRVRLVHARFSALGETLEGLGYSRPAADGILADLGLSSWQLDDGKRGFSFASDGPLDMRMDRQAAETALSVLQNLDEKTLSDLLSELGEEPMARPYARAIKEELARGELSSPRDLADVISEAAGPKRVGTARKHVATRTFMAIRMAVNEELEELEALLSHAPGWLKPGGRMAVLTYHSLEDRRVKDRFNRLERPEREVPHDLPLKNNELPRGEFRRVTTRPVTPSAEEIKDNPRSRSAKLRVLERKER